MTETPVVVDIQSLFEGDFTLQKYSALRNAAQSNEANARSLEDLVAAMEGAKGAVNHMKRGIGLWVLGRSLQAMEELKKGHPSEELASIFLGKALLDLDEPAKANVVYREALAEHADSRPIAYGLVFAILRLGDFEEATKILDRAEKRFGADVETRFLRGFHSELVGEYGEAREAYEEVLEQRELHPHALFRLARWEQTWGDEERAIELYEKIRTARPTFANALLNLGNLYEDYQKYDLAMECYRDVLQSIPSHSRATMFLHDAQSSKSMFYDEEGERRADRQSAILKIPVTDFELSVRSRNCLNKMNVKTLGDLIQMTEQDLLAHKNFGETSLMEVKQMLAQKGLRLGQGKIEGGAYRAPLQQVEVSEEILNESIDALALSVRSRKCMERLGIVSLGQLISRTEAELLSAKNFGQTSLNEIKARLEERGLRLKDSPY